MNLDQLFEECDRAYSAEGKHSAGLLAVIAVVDEAVRSGRLHVRSREHEVSKENGSTMGSVDYQQMAADLARAAVPLAHERAPIWLDGDAWDVADRSGANLRLIRRSDRAEVLVQVSVKPWQK